MIKSRCTAVKALGNTMRPPSGSRANPAMTVSTSAGSWTGDGFQKGSTKNSCPFRKLDPGVLVVQASQNGNCGDAAKALDRPFEWAIFIQSQMRTRLIVIHSIGRKNSPQVCLTEDDHMIQAFASQRADQTFSDTILPWRSGRDRPVADAHRDDAAGKDLPISPVIIAHQIGRGRCPGERFGDLPGEPERGRV